MTVKTKSGCAPQHMIHSLTGCLVSNNQNLKRLKDLTSDSSRGVTEVKRAARFLARLDHRREIQFLIFDRDVVKIPRSWKFLLRH